MRLDHRLRLLRGTVALEPAPTPEKSDLAERLRRLAPATRRSPLPGAPDEQALAERLGALILAPGLLRTERRIDLGAHHGRMILRDCVKALPALVDADAGDPSTWLFLDTETSGLAGGTGTWAFLCGLVRIEGPDLLLRQYLLTRLDAEPAYLEALRGELTGPRLLVTYNGKSFDTPLLTTRFRLAGMQAPLDDQAHLDLLYPVRRVFRRIWPDCRLATAEVRLLGFRRDGDLPGAEAPRAWLAWLRQGEIGPLAGVLDHNRLDLLSLPALAPALERSFRDPAATGADIRAVASHHLKAGDAATALRLLVTHRDALSTAGLLDLARLHRLRGEWRSALEIWEPLAARGDIEALAYLAKYLEHRIRDYRRALAIARRLPPGSAREHRCRRLEERLGERQGRRLPGDRNGCLVKRSVTGT